MAFRLDAAAVLRSATEKMPSGTVSGTGDSSAGSWSRVAAAGETPPLDPGRGHRWSSPSPIGSCWPYGVRA